MPIDEYGSQRPFSDEESKIVGRRYDVVTKLPFYGDVSLGNMTQFKISMFRVPEGHYNGWLSVGIEGHGTYIFDSWVHAGYAGEKLGIRGSDAESMADFINCQLGSQKLTADQQEHYQPDLCR